LTALSRIYLSLLLFLFGVLAPKRPRHILILIICIYLPGERKCVRKQKRWHIPVALISSGRTPPAYFDGFPFHPHRSRVDCLFQRSATVLSRKTSTFPPDYFLSKICQLNTNIFHCFRELQFFAPFLVQNYFLMELQLFEFWSAHLSRSVFHSAPPRSTLFTQSPFWCKSKGCNFFPDSVLCRLQGITSVCLKALSLFPGRLREFSVLLRL
jgi:hypothetical protein